MKQSLNLTCPVCQSDCQKEVVTRLNTQQNPELKDALMTGKLLTFECPTCGAKRQMDTQFLYHDPEKKLMIFLIPNYRANSEEIQDLLDDLVLQEGVAIHDYNLRVVLHGTDLIEKISVFDYGYHDQEVEIVKVLTDGLFAKEFPDKQVQARFFYMQANTPKILYITDQDQLLVDFHDSLLEFAQTKFSKSLADQHLSQFLMVSQAWALELLDTKHKLKTENSDDTDEN